MLEIHATIYNESSNQFCDRWRDDCFERETIVDGECSIYIDQYTKTERSIPHYEIRDELIIVFDGDLHDLRSEFEYSCEQPLLKDRLYDVIAAAYQRFGWRFPQYLIGDYRFLIFDQSSRQMIVGRDKTTYDPVYVASDDHSIAISTDLSALAAERETTVNGQYLGQYLTGTIEPEYQTFYSAIERIPPGCLAIISDGSLEIKRYYHPRTEKRAAYRQLTNSDLGEILRQKLEEAITCRIADIETTGIFMSGGADSTAIAGLASNLSNTSVLKTYSYIFPNTIEINEVDGINAAIDEYSIHNECISLDEYWILKDKPLYERAWAIAPPVDPFLQPKDELLRRAARDGKKTILTGDKGNMFDGHRLSIADALRTGAYTDAITTAREDPSYTTAAALVRYGLAPLLNVGTTHEIPSKQVQAPVRSRLTTPIRTKIEKYRQSQARRHQFLQDFSDQLTYRMLTSPIFDYQFDVFRKLAHYHGIRAIDPYQDSRLIEFVFDLPPTSNVKGGTRKTLFRIALRDILPQYIISREKTDRVEEEAAEGLRREQPYVEGLLEYRFLQDHGIIHQQFTPDVTSSIDAFGNINTRPTHLWEYLAAQKWLDSLSPTVPSNSTGRHAHPAPRGRHPQHWESS